jgi:hypothetical protein
MTKDKTTASRIKELESAIEGLKSKMFDMTTRIEEAIKEHNKLSVVFDYHAHPTVLTSQRPFFLEEQYLATLKKQQEAQGQPVQPPVPQPIPEEEAPEE